MNKHNYFNHKGMKGLKELQLFAFGFVSSSILLEI